MTHPYTIPNLLTALRIAMIPAVVVLFFLPFTWADMACGLMFALAGITDSFDGYLARRLGQVSPLGEFLDPVADKLIDEVIGEEEVTGNVIGVDAECADQGFEHHHAITRCIGLGNLVVKVEQALHIAVFQSRGSGQPRAARATLFTGQRRTGGGRSGVCRCWQDAGGTAYIAIGAAVATPVASSAAKHDIKLTLLMGFISLTLRVKPCADPARAVWRSIGYPDRAVQSGSPCYEPARSRRRQKGGDFNRCST